MENELGLHGLVVMPGNCNQEVNHVEVIYASLHALALYLFAILACNRYHCEEHYRIIMGMTFKCNSLICSVLICKKMKKKKILIFNFII